MDELKHAMFLGVQKFCQPHLWDCCWFRRRVSKSTKWCGISNLKSVRDEQFKGREQILELFPKIIDSAALWIWAYDVSKPGALNDITILQCYSAFMGVLDSTLIHGFEKSQQEKRKRIYFIADIISVLWLVLG